MKTTTKNHPEFIVKNNWKFYLVFFSTSLFFSLKGLAENALSSTQSAEEITKDLEHQTFMSYIYMVAGFIAIIAIAWFSVAKSKKSGDDGATNHSHDAHHHHHHAANDKKYGTNRAH